MSTTDDAVATFVADTALAHEIVHGDSNTTVMTEGGPVRSFAKLLADNQAAILANQPLTPQAYGAVGDLVADDSNAVKAAYAAALALKKPLAFTTWYRCANSVVFDLATIALTGVKIIGTAGRQNCGLQFDTNVESPNLLITSSTVADAFYPDLMGWGVKGNVAGKVLQIGKEDFSDLINEPTLDLVVNNGSEDPSACAVEMNAVYNHMTRIVANCGGAGTGDALRLRQVQFGVFEGSTGNAGNCIHLTGGYSVGNNFNAIDMEVATNAITIDSAKAVHNTWTGGTIANVTKGINATAGNCNKVVNPNLGIPAADLVLSATGVYIDLPGVALLATPAIPVSGTPYANQSGQVQFVTVLNGTVTGIVLDGATLFETTNVSFLLNPGSSVVVTYSAAPSWNFTPMFG